MKKEYINPTMQVVVIKHRIQLLAGSGRSANSLNEGSTFSWDGDGIENEEADM